MAEIFNILPTTRDTHLYFRFRFFFRISYTSAISNFPMGYVDWISFQELLEGQNTPALTVGKVSEIEWTTGPKQRTNQWSCPPFILLDKVCPSRYALGLDPSTATAKSKILALIALDPERLHESNPEFMLDIGDNQFPYYLQRKSRYATNAKGEGNEEVDDDEVSQNSSCSVESSVDSEREEIPKFSALPPNVMDFLSYMYSIDWILNKYHP